MAKTATMISSAGRIGKNAGHVFLTTLSTAMLQWIMMAAIARFEGPAALGSFALAQAYVTPVSYLAWLSIRQQFLVSKTLGGTPADFVALRVVVPAIMFVATLALLHVIGGSYDMGIFVSVFLMRYLEGFFDLQYGQLQMKGAYSTLSALSLERFGYSLIVFFPVYFLLRDITQVTLVMCATWAVIYAVQRRRDGYFPSVPDAFSKGKASFTRCLRLARELFPFGVSLVVMSLGVAVPRILVEAKLGVHDLGLFAAVFHFLAVGSIVVSALGHAILPRLSRSIDRNEESKFWWDIAGASLIMIVLAFIAAGLSMIIGEKLVTLLYGPLFAGQQNLLTLAAVVGGFVYASSIFNNGCYAAQMKRGMFISQTSCVITIFVSGMFLLEWMGVAGAYIAMLLGSVVQFLVSLMMLLSFWRARKADMRGLV